MNFTDTYCEIMNVLQTDAISKNDNNVWGFTELEKYCCMISTLLDMQKISDLHSVSLSVPKRLSKGIKKIKKSEFKIMTPLNRQN